MRTAHQRILAEPYMITFHNKMTIATNVLNKKGLTLVIFTKMTSFPNNVYLETAWSNEFVLCVFFCRNGTLQGILLIST